MPATLNLYLIVGPDRSQIAPSVVCAPTAGHALRSNWWARTGRAYRIGVAAEGVPVGRIVSGDLVLDATLEAMASLREEV